MTSPDNPVPARRRAPATSELKHAVTFAMCIAFVMALVVSENIVVATGSEPIKIVVGYFDLSISTVPVLVMVFELCSASAFLLIVRGCSALEGPSLSLRINAWFRKHWKRDRSQAEFRSVLGTAQFSLALILAGLWIWLVPEFLAFPALLFLFALPVSALLLSLASGLAFRPVPSMIAAIVCGAIACGLIRTA
ncbi:hypothetical protein [Rhizobium halophytocola]|uniref:DNA-binding transcriptional LysR family regulator n=1 Tax=Rhizobium halophytocola TaxID=735519 RepID=A0ABS4DZK1_9HYPH|nr:hypothetical protein [Rhizobium halophytocola]MBP1851115.1 DNA-binding transcriptional LysR family regulator [Rhizobium halophytocola]